LGKQAKGRFVDPIGSISPLPKGAITGPSGIKSADVTSSHLLDNVCHRIGTLGRHQPMGLAFEQAVRMDPQAKANRCLQKGF
jgi:hypothetical protein